MLHSGRATTLHQGRKNDVNNDDWHSEDGDDGDDGE